MDCTEVTDLPRFLDLTGSGSVRDVDERVWVTVLIPDVYHMEDSKEAFDCQNSLVSWEAGMMNMTNFNLM